MSRMIFVKGHGFMYNRRFADSDGHIREAVWMNPAAFPSNNPTN